jgi:hypothetical protein
MTFYQDHCKHRKIEILDLDFDSVCRECNKVLVHHEVAEICRVMHNL